MNLTLLIGILIPFVGTSLGAAMVFLVKKEINPSIQKLLLGFASGVMIAASVWSLLIPAIEMSQTQGRIAWIPPSVGFFVGMGFLLLPDRAIPHLDMETDKPRGIKSTFGKSAMLVLAVTLHNIPEGMAVGVVFAGALSGDTGISLAGAFALAVGIAIQNIPEGAVISMPLLGEGMSNRRAFQYGTLSGIVEPIGAAITIFLTGIITPVLPYILSFAAGAMMYVVVAELIPEAQAGEDASTGTIGVALGFALMMVLDVALG